MNRRSKYIVTQAAAIAEVLGERYGRSVQVDNDHNFVMIPEFRLPKRWGMRSTPILIWFPKKYPDTPPNGFYLSKNCRGPHVFSTNIFGDSPDLSHLGWNWYCVHMDRGWKPGGDPLEPDNLWTVLDIIRMSLTISEF